MDPSAAHDNALGFALIKQGRFREAVACLQQALATAPEYAVAHNNLGNAYTGLGRWEDAAAAYRASISCRPEYAKPWSNLGEVLLRRGELDEAERVCRRAIELAPESAPAHNNLGNALRYQRRFHDAQASYQTALRLKPDYPLAHCNLGIVLRELGQLAEAEEQIRDALRLQPGLAGAHGALGNVQLDRDNFAEAAACFRTAIELAPDFAMAWHDRAVTLQYLGRQPESLTHFERALRICPDDDLIRQNFARALLLGGDFRRGWQHFERSSTRGASGSPRSSPPEWDGSPLRGRTLLLRAEQGLGDAIQFVRFAMAARPAGLESGAGNAPATPQLASDETHRPGSPSLPATDQDRSQEGRVVLTCRPALTALLKTCPGIDGVVSDEEKENPPAADVHARLLRMPAILNTTLETIPHQVPYLFARDDLRTKWHPELDRIDGFRVGIAWQGNPEFIDDRRRSVPLAHFQPLSEIEGVRLISLQKGFGTEQLGQVDFPVIDLGSRLDEQTGAFEDTAAVMAQLDLIISSDTSLVHLAGALGVPVWVALAFLPDWRFLLDREDSPWYPTMRLFRQERPGDWDGVFRRLAEQLHHTV